jgi:hypothetical protein
MVNEVNLATSMLRLARIFMRKPGQHANILQAPEFQKLKEQICERCCDATLLSRFAVMVVAMFWGVRVN